MISFLSKLFLVDRILNNSFEFVNSLNKDCVIFEFTRIEQLYSYLYANSHNSHNGTINVFKWICDIYVDNELAVNDCNIFILESGVMYVDKERSGFIIHNIHNTKVFEHPLKEEFEFSIVKIHIKNFYL